VQTFLSALAGKNACPTRSWKWLVIMRFAMLFLAFGFVGCGLPTNPASSPDPVQPDLDYPVGTFSLTERSGKTVTDQDLRGHVWVASFIFTRCNGPCPQVTSTVARLQAELKDLPDVRFVTFTVDPKRDDLAALRKYADSRSADPKRWLFLTGDESTIHTLMREQFKQPVEHKMGPEVQPGDEFGHSSRLVLVDKKNVIRAMCDGLPNEHFPERFETDLARFQKRIRELEGEKP
jgi:protein SCO1/2